MSNFDKQLERAKEIDPELVSKALFDYIKTLREELIGLNKKQLNEDSQDIHGKAIGFYSKATEIITGGAKGAGEPFNAKDTGSFLDKFYMTVYNDVFFFGSTDPKTDDILSSDNWLSADLFGLTEENLNQVIETRFKPFIIDYYKKQLLL
jgi:hypothetical protein